ncbi:MAG: matrixin family metalloprotease [Gemmatimonadetes bacterium]|nr:matrixin family metalloprotease [Gemmatimonadota bacterium]
MRRVIFFSLLLLAWLGAFWLGRSAASRTPGASRPPAPPETTVTVAAVAVLKDSLRAARARLLQAIAERDTYLPAMLIESDSLVRRWPERVARPIRVYLPEPAISGYTVAMGQAVENAFARWERVGGIPVSFSVVRDSANVDVGVRWVDAFQFERAGQADIVWDRQGWVVHGTLTLATHTFRGHPLSADAVQTVALHEIGHLLGLGHSDDARDVMYASTEVHDLTLRDRQTAQLLYALPPGSLRLP